MSMYFEIISLFLRLFNAAITIIIVTLVLAIQNIIIISVIYR